MDQTSLDRVTQMSQEDPADLHLHLGRSPSSALGCQNEGDQCSKGHWPYRFVCMDYDRIHVCNEQCDKEDKSESREVGLKTVYDIYRHHLTLLRRAKVGRR